MTDSEKVDLLRNLRAQAMKRLRFEQISIRVTHPESLLALSNRISKSCRGEAEVTIPDDFTEVSQWLFQDDNVALQKVVQETQQYVIDSRTSDIIMHLVALNALRTLTQDGSRLKVVSSFKAPTASITVTFAPSYWSTPMEKDEDLIVRLNDIAAQEKFSDGKLTFVQYVLQTLSPEEQQRIRAIAAAEGVKTEIYLHQMQVKTLAAKADIQKTIDTATQLKNEGHKSRITSEHETASGTTKIEIDNSGKGFGCSTMIATLSIAVLWLLYFVR